MKITVSDTIQTSESLTNYKPWFNGMKLFSSVRVLKALLPDDLDIALSDDVDVTTTL